MSVRFDGRVVWLLAVTLALTSFAWVSAQQRRGSASGVAIDADDIGGVVTGPKGPEAGVWVIAETTATPTKFARIVVTDDQGRYVVPDLPGGRYELFVRGYGLVDSPRVQARAGDHVDLKAVPAPDGKAAAKIYPPSYWLSLMDIAKGPMPEQQLISIVKECLQCHPIGNEGTRTPKLAPGQSSLDAWDQRTKGTGLAAMMGGTFQRFGPQRKMFADWTDKIAAGAYPRQAPPRPGGLERNAVLTVWDWATPKGTRSDSQATYDWDPRVNANGLVYGAHSDSSALAWLDPKTNTAGLVETGVGGLRSIAMDDQSRVWVTGNYAQGEQAPAFCRPDSQNTFAKYFRIPGRGKQVVMYDPKTKKVEKIPSCMSVDHNHLGKEADKPLYFGNNGHIGWISTATWDRTHDVEASQGWCPMVLDTNGDGAITEWTEPDQPIDPKKDHRINAGCYSIAISPTDGSLWCSGIGANDRQLVRIERGSSPPRSCKAEIFTPPPGGKLPFYKTGGVAVDDEGVAWLNWRGSEQVTSFDRRKCRVTSGALATGEQCPDGWATYQMDRPKLQGTSVPSHAEMMYLTQADHHDGLGLGKATVITGPVNSYSLQLFLPRQATFLDIVVPYPMGFFSRSAQARIDDPADGWKGRGVWSNYSTYTPHFIEGGTGPKVVKFQMRPNPLAK